MASVTAYLCVSIQTLKEGKRRRLHVSNGVSALDGPCKNWVICKLCSEVHSMTPNIGALDHSNIQ